MVKGAIKVIIIIILLMYSSIFKVPLWPFLFSLYVLCKYYLMVICHRVTLVFSKDDDSSVAVVDEEEEKGG